MKEYMDLQLELLQYETMVERRDEKIKRLKELIEAQDDNDYKRFRCWHCKAKVYDDTDICKECLEHCDTWNEEGE